MGGPGVLISSGVTPDSGAFLWISCVAYAIIAGLVSRMLVMPTGILAERAVGSGAALLVYFWLTRRNLFAGIFAGALALSVIRL